MMKPSQVSREDRSPSSASDTSVTIETPREQPTKTARPCVCLGMPLYNQTEFLPAALDAILGQTYKHFRLVVADDSTSPEPGDIVKKYASQDSRICYVKNPARKGLIDNWRRCFDLSGDADYFGWVGDHDLWHPEFLASMVEVLNSNPSAVLSYPKTVHITTEDARKSRKKTPRLLSTLGMSESDRVKTVCLDTRGFGKMVYGLFRSDALRSAGIFRHVLFPDVVLMFELSLKGDFIQIDRELRFHRHTAKFSILRQKRSLFVKTPWYIFLPWPFVNAFLLLWHTAVNPCPGNRRRLFNGVRVSVFYLRRYLGMLGQGSWVGSYNEWTKGKKPWIKKLRKRQKELKQDLEQHQNHCD